MVLNKTEILLSLQQRFPGYSIVEREYTIMFNAEYSIFNLSDVWYRWGNSVVTHDFFWNIMSEEFWVRLTSQLYVLATRY